MIIKCEICGSNDLVKKDGYYVCQYCNTKYSLEDAKKLIVEGTVKIDNSEQIEKYYKIAREARDCNNANDAFKYYDLIRQERPDDWEASFFSIYYRAIQTNLANLVSASHDIGACIPNTITRIKENLSPSQYQEAISLIGGNLLNYVVSAFETIKHHYESFSDVQGVEQDKNNQALSVTYVLWIMGNELEKNFPDDSDVTGIAVSFWETGISMLNSCHVNVPTEINTYKDKIAKYNPTSKYLSSSPQSTSAAGCYIATAVYGSYDCPEVWTLRRYRDYTLAATWYGRIFIRVYYSVSPLLVKWFGKTRFFKRMWHRKLDRMVKRLNEQGVKNTPYKDREW